MKILRPMTRRDFSIKTAGWFTVLKPNTWFPASRLAAPYRYRPSQSPGSTGIHIAAAPKIITLPAEDRGKMRSGLTLLAAMAITWALLWWIMHP